MHDSQRFSMQAGEYAFPYHWLTSFEEDGRVWSTGRRLRWGLEHLGILHAVTETVIALRPQSVLDVGCGDGRLVHELLERGVPHVEGVDLVPRAIAFAKAFLGDERSALVSCVAVEDGPTGPFEVISLIEVLEHIPDAGIPSVLEAVRARLAPNGRLVVSVPTTNVPLIPKHERHYDAALLDRHLGARFEVVERRWLHRDTRLSRGLRAATTNRYVGLHWLPAIRLITRLYGRHVLAATPDDGGHLLVVARPR